MSVLQDLAFSAGLLKELPDNTEDLDTRLSRFHNVVAKWHISPFLETVPTHWKVNSILTVLGQEEVRQNFENQGISDFWLPLSRPILRRLVKDNGSATLFFQCQQVLLGNVPRRKRSFTDPSSTPFTHHAIEDDEEWVTEIRNLGEGAFGIVDEVSVSSEPHEVVCVRKRIEKPKNLKGLTKVMEAFTREVNVMRLVDHHHCVRFIASYTDPQHVNILSGPVADTDLAHLLDQPLSPETEEILYRGIGCLCNAVAYLHRNQIRHEDLKPQNVLILRGEILLTDFGFSLDFSDDSVSTTTGRPSAWTIRYSAPEVLAFEPRNRATDIFSLGCILVEMISGIVHRSLTQVKRYWKEHGNLHPSFAQNTDATVSWILQLKSVSAREELSRLCDYVPEMLSPNRNNRPNASQVVDHLKVLSIRFSTNLETRQCNHTDCHGLLPSSQVMEQFKHMMSQLPRQRLSPSSDPTKILDYLFPLTFETGTYGLWYLTRGREDLNISWFFDRTWRNEDNKADIAIRHHRSFVLSNKDEVMRHCHYLYSNARRNGATSDFWSAHESGKHSNNLSGFVNFSDESIKRLILRHVVFCHLPVWQVGMQIPPKVAGYLNITLVPLCSNDKKSFDEHDAHGIFFFMISHMENFDPEQHYIHPTETPHIIDLTV